MSEDSHEAKTILELVKMQQQTEEGKYCSLRAIYQLLVVHNTVLLWLFCILTDKLPQAKKR